MAKPKIPNQKQQYNALNKRLNKYVLGVKMIFDRCNQEAANIAINTGYDGGKEFSFADYPYTKQAVDDLMAEYVSDMEALIYRGTSEEWKESNLVQDLMVTDVLRTYNASRYGDKFAVYYQTNSDQLRAFQQRVDNGMNLSKRLWNQSASYKSALEFTIGAAIEKGMSAVTLSKQVSQFLNNYPKLKATYAEKYGKAINPKQCQYAAMRLARSEINMAYRTAEQTRWNQLDFVVGKEIKLSGAHPDHDICDMLAGKYPKDFKWVGWHPNDMCYEIPILNTQDEFWDIDNTGSKNEIKQVPDAMKQWIVVNSQRIANAEKRGTLPYWIRDNHWLLNSKEAIKHAADVRHAKRNDQAIIDKWNERKARMEAAKQPQLTPVQMAAEKRHAERDVDIINQRLSVRQSMTANDHNYIAMVRRLADKYGVDRKQFEAQYLAAKDRNDVIKAADAIKAEIVQKRAAMRHAMRPDGYAEAIAKQRNDNMSTLKYANSVRSYMSGISDLDLSALDQAIKSGNYATMLAEAKNVRAIGKSIKALSNIEDQMSVVRQYSIAEAKAVDSAIAGMKQKWSTITDLNQLEKTIKFEINYVDTHRKYSTWQISKKAYEKELQIVQDKIFIRDATSQLQQFSTFNTKSSIYKKLLADCQTAINAGNKQLAQSYLTQIQQQQAKLQAAAAKAAAKKTAASGTMPSNPFDPSSYTPERMNIGWVNTPKECDDLMRKAFGQAWNSMTQDEKNALWCYTWTYSPFNMMLRGQPYQGARWKFNIYQKYHKHLENAIGKCVIDHDQWFQRNGSFAELSRWSKKPIGYHYSDAEIYALEGKEGTEDAYWSFTSRKNDGKMIDGTPAKIIINCFVPKGTKGAYVEPIAAWGNGAGHFLDKRGQPPSWTLSWSTPKNNYDQAPKWDGVSGQQTFSNQQETLLQRGTKSKVIKVTKGTNHGVLCWFIDIQITGQI